MRGSQLVDPTLYLLAICPREAPPLHCQDLDGGQWRHSKELAKACNRVVGILRCRHHVRHLVATVEGSKHRVE
jgi:hypothetical protein